jgi:hypothetical protein
MWHPTTGEGIDAVTKCPTIGRYFRNLTIYLHQVCVERSLEQVGSLTASHCRVVFFIQLTLLAGWLVVVVYRLGLGISTIAPIIFKPQNSEARWAVKVLCTCFRFVILIVSDWH